MEYTSLNDNILSLLHSADYNFVLKLYDKEGNTTLEAEDIQWIYIENKNIMIELPKDNETSICFWKETKSEDDDIIKLIQRIREIAILNGLNVQIRTYDNLDRRKIYNMIKQAIIKSKGNTMESTNKNVSKALYELSNIIANTKRPSDFYINESLSAQNKKSFMDNIITAVTNIDSLNNTPVKKLLSYVMMENSFKRINKIVDSFEQKKPEEYSKIVKNI